MERQRRKNKVENGKTNAYIINLMVHADTRFMDEYSLRPRINKRFGCHLRANEVKKYHLNPLCDRRWLKRVEIEGENGYTTVLYRRFGGFDNVSPEETLKDQFADLHVEDPDFPGIEDEYSKRSYIEHLDDEAWDEPDFFGSMTEKESDDYFDKEYEEHLKMEEEFYPERKLLTEEELDNLLK